MLIIVYILQILKLLCHFHPPKNKVHFTLRTTHTFTQDALTVSVVSPLSPNPTLKHTRTHTYPHIRGPLSKAGQLPFLRDHMSNWDCC